MSASADDYFHKVGRSTATTLSAPGYTVGNASINVASTTNWPPSTGVTFAIDETDPDGNRIAGTYNVFRGTVSGATQVNNLTYVGGDANRDYSAASTTRVYILVSSYRDNRFTDGILVEHNQDGTHSDVTADSIVVTGDVTAANFIQSGGSGADGWTVGLPAVSSVTALGNRSYTMVMASDVSATLSEGMRLRTTRTVASTQNAFSLDGSNDYYNKTSPSGMTFTDDFSVSAWVYATSYQQGVIASRWNGTNGWDLRLNTSGQILLVGINAGAANASYVQSYQSIPLNKWVHIAAQLDMSTFTATTTTSYIMIDGVNVPASVTRSGTNPTALIQAGNLEIGSYNGGANPFPGYIDQVAIYSAKVTQATHLAAMHQGLTGSETSLISAYANGSTTDLNTTNANNLTAQNGATTVASAPWGNRGASTTLDYALVMKVDDDEITVQVPEGCTIPTSGGVSAVAYSTQANPFGWVSDKGRWTIEAIIAGDVTGTSSITYTNLFNQSINLPVGQWVLGYRVGFYAYTGGASNKHMLAALSTSTTGGDRKYGSRVNGDSVITIGAQLAASGFESITTPTPYYLNYKSAAAFTTVANGADTRVAIEAINAYL